MTTLLISSEAAMITDADHQEFWQYEADKLALVERLIKRVRISVSLMALIPFSFSLMAQGFGQSLDAGPYFVMAMMIVMIGGFGSMTAKSYVESAKARIEGGRGGTPSQEK
jgi:hypothetical protein